MMKKAFLFTATCLILLMIPSASFCEGYGFISWGRAWPTVGMPGFLEDQIPTLKGVEFNLQYDHFTFGYLYDSAASWEDLFSWRFSFGVDIAISEYQDMKNADAATQALVGSLSLFTELFDTTGYGFATKFTYGIGLIRTETFRFWVGPSVRINANYSNQKAKTIEIYSVPFEVDPWGVNLSAGGGLDAGLTYILNPYVSLDLSGGFHYNFFAYYQDAGMKVSSVPVPDDRAFLLGQEYFAFVQLAFLFRFSNDVDGY